MSKRILFITDSLGCPRMEINVVDTWTDKILSKWSDKTVHFYTYCRHGLASKDIDVGYVKEVEPDLIIIQVGIVDACRRSLSRRELNIVSRIPLVRRIIRFISNRYHHALTRIRNVHYCSLDEFKKSIAKIKNEMSAKLVFISIAPAGNNLVKKVYNVQEDINRYNAAVKEMPDVDFINPYTGNADDFILSTDGHHLNLRGEEMVFQAVDKVIKDFLKGEHDA